MQDNACWKHMSCYEWKFTPQQNVITATSVKQQYKQPGNDSCQQKSTVWNADFFRSKSILGRTKEFWVKKRPRFLGRFLLLSEGRLFLSWIYSYLTHSCWWRQTCSHLSCSAAIRRLSPTTTLKHISHFCFTYLTLLSLKRVIYKVKNLQHQRINECYRGIHVSSLSLLPLSSPPPFPPSSLYPYFLIHSSLSSLPCHVIKTKLCPGITNSGPCAGVLLQIFSREFFYP